MKTLILIIVFASLLYASPGDKIKELHQFNSEFFYGFSCDTLTQKAFLEKQDEIVINTYNLYSWTFISSFEPLSNTPSISTLPSKHLNALTLMKDSQLEIYDYLNNKFFSVSLSFQPIAASYVVRNGHNYLYVVEYKKKRLQVLDADNGYALVEEMQIQLSDTEFKSGCYQLGYDGEADLLLCVVYESTSLSIVYALDPDSLTSKGNFVWNGKSIRGIDCVNNYPAIGRCYLVSYWYQSLPKVVTIDAVETFPKVGFNKENCSYYELPPQLSTFPNPFSSHLSLSLPSQASIYSLTGQLIKTLPKGKHEVDTSSWKAGVYIIRCGTETKRIVKID